MIQAPDVLIIGSGIGGGTLASRLVQHGFQVTLLERGSFLPQEDQNWQVSAVFGDERYAPCETWLNKEGQSFRPGTYYYVGGSSKMYGATMLRYRKEDFEEMAHEDGVSPGWPISYEQLAPYYDLAEQMYCVHGTAGQDPTEPPCVPAYPYPAMMHEPVIAQVDKSLKSMGIQSFPIPLAIQRDQAGNCIRCSTCDGFPCKIHAKGDAETAAVQPALTTGRLTLLTGARVTRLDLSPDGKQVQGVTFEKDGMTQQLSAPLVVVAASAVNSAALLLSSACPQAPNGVANSSDVVGRFYMAHNNTALMSVGWKRNPTTFQKTVCINDFYFGDKSFKFPMGNIQGLGKMHEYMLTAKMKLLPSFLARLLTERSVDWWVMSEDLPHPDNRITIENGQIRLHYTANNMAAHRKLVKATTSLMRRIGLPLNLPKYIGENTTSHQCGTVRFGNDPAAAALNSFCRSFDHQNLFVVDSSFFPSSAAVNPALTIAAQALRVADHIATTDLASSERRISMPLPLERLPPLVARADSLVAITH